MRLELSFSPAWTLKYAPDGQVAAILPGAPRALPRAIVTFGPLVLVSDEPRAWQDSTARAGAPAGTHTQASPGTDLTTETGWPLRLIPVIVRSATNEVVEVRLCACYAFLEHVGAAIVRCASERELEEQKPALLAILRTGRPNWRGDEAVSLADAWDLAPARSARAPEPPPRAETAIRAKIDAWTRELAGDPERIDTRYNLGVAEFALGNHTAALAAFERVVAAEPDDLLTTRKVIQCLYALGRDEHGDRMRTALRARWAMATDPRARRIHEYVFDQIPCDGFTVYAVETLQALTPAIEPVVTFRVVVQRGTHGDVDEPLPVAVLVETSERARAAGTPFIIGMSVGSQFRVVEALTELPPYAALKQRAIPLLQQALTELAAKR